MSGAHTPEQRPQDATTGQLISQVTEQMGALVRTEMELARAEFAETTKRAGLGAGLFGVAGIIALYGLGALLLTIGLALALVMDSWLAALIVTVVLFVIAAVAALLGKRQVSKVAPPVQQSVANVQRDVETIKHGSDGNNGNRTGASS